MKFIVYCLILGISVTAHAFTTNYNKLGWSGCEITKRAFMKELANAYFKKTGIRINLGGGGATRGIRDVASRRTQMGGACRAKLELTSIERNAKQIPVAWDALAVIVHPSNPVTQISLAQLRDVYRGKITNWIQLGGRDARLELYARQSKISGVGYTLRELVFNNPKERFKATRFFKSTKPLELAVERNPNALATTGVSSAKRRAITIMQLDGKDPSYENIRRGKYLLYRPLYLVIHQFEKDARILGFKKFALSKAGQAIIRSTGNVPYADAVQLVMKQLLEKRRALNIKIRD